MGEEGSDGGLLSIAWLLEREARPQCRGVDAGKRCTVVTGAKVPLERRGGIGLEGRAQTDVENLCPIGGRGERRCLTFNREARVRALSPAPLGRVPVKARGWGGHGELLGEMRVFDGGHGARVKAKRHVELDGDGVVRRGGHGKSFVNTVDACLAFTHKSHDRVDGQGFERRDIGEAELRCPECFEANTRELAGGEGRRGGSAAGELHAAHCDGVGLQEPIVGEEQPFGTLVCHRAAWCRPCVNGRGKNAAEVVDEGLVEGHGVSFCRFRHLRGFVPNNCGGT